MNVKGSSVIPMIFIKPLSSFWEKFPCFFYENSSTRERERDRERERERENVQEVVM